MEILIVKTSSLGDIIHAFPVLSYLKERHPEAKIDWVVEQPFAEMVKAHPMVNHVLEIQTKKWCRDVWKSQGWREIFAFRKTLRRKQYDLVLDLQGNTKSALVTANARSCLKVGFGRKTVPEWPNLLVTHRHVNPPEGLNVRHDYLYVAQSALGDFSEIFNEGVQLKLNEKELSQFLSFQQQLKELSGLKVLICPGSNWTNKQLSKEALQTFLQCFHEEMNPINFIFIWGSQVEKELGESISALFPQNSVVIEKLSLPLLQNLMNKIDLVLAMDSLPLHLAATTSTPTYSIFGASSADKYKPLGKAHEAFQGSCPYNRQFVKRCDLLRTCSTGACIKALEGQALFSHFREWWKGL